MQQAFTTADHKVLYRTRIADGCLRGRQYRHALHWLEDMTCRAVSVPQVWFLHGSALAGLGHRDRARQSYEQAWQLCPENPLYRRHAHSRLPGGLGAMFRRWFS